MVTERDVVLSDGRTLHVYDTGAAGADDRLAVFWHHGTPNISAPPEPLFTAADQLGIRWVSYDRPGYGGTPSAPGRNLASAATYVSSIADALGIDRFAVMGHSGGGSHALACGALLPERVLGVVSVAGLAPFGADGLDWFGGMHSGGVKSLQTAMEGRKAKERYEASDPVFDPDMFTSADRAALEGAWSWLGSIVGPAMENGPDGLIDDDLAYVTPWDADPAQVVAPTLLLYGGRDRVVPSSHGEWLSRRIPSAELWLRPDDGHISILNSTASALEWLGDSAH